MLHCGFVCSTVLYKGTQNGIMVSAVTVNCGSTVIAIYTIFASYRLKIPDTSILFNTTVF